VSRMWLPVALGNGMSMLQGNGKRLILSARSGILTNLSPFMTMDEAGHKNVRFGSGADIRIFSGLVVYDVVVC
jgi:hypothetical protein